MRMIKLSFPGGMRIEAHVGDHVVATDQSPQHGGRGSAPSPFDLFLTSLVTCNGVYALRFCQRHGIPTDELEVSMEYQVNPDTGMVDEVTIAVKVPPSFPAEHKDALVRAMSQCTVKKHLLQPPAIHVEVT